MPTGTVKFYNDQKGYGFAPDGGGNDVFVHATALERAGISGLREGQKVSFETEVDAGPARQPYAPSALLSASSCSDGLPTHMKK